ncbi:MAG: tetratricopeptide repeat protein [Desulfobacteraceae bacterium]|nr:MAG: tetratricopeptide repeat protein [Desulfobacteraceae bacterium]
MDLVNSVSAENIFISTASQQSQLEELANRALSNGIDLYMRKDYEGAAKAFQRSIGLAPQSQYSVDASNYMANAYLKLNQTEKAIKAYKTSIDLNPYRNDTHITLGNLYFSEKRYKEAEIEYKEAVRLSPIANNYYALGQAYLELGQYNDAENQFNTVKRLAPDSPNGNYGLGLAYSRQGRFEDAIRQFKEAIGIENNLYDAYAEMGYAYADLGQMDKAQEQVDYIEQERPDLAQMLSLYMYKVDPPKFMFAYSTSFMYLKSVKTQVSALDSYLANANTSKTFTMKFSFSKEMDRDSVEDRFNWKIGRASGSGPGQAYNFGLPVPSTEISIPPYPDYVFYDSEASTATIYFTIHQNASADGTIDPSHIEFKFNGEDRYGFTMDPERDQFSGFSKVA